MGFIEQNNYGERLLMCAIIESAVNDFVSMADDPETRISIHFKTAEKFLFGNGTIERILLRHPETGEILDEQCDNYIGCTLNKFTEMLTLDGQTLNVKYIRQGVIKKLKDSRCEKITKDRNNRWIPNKD